MTTAIITRLGGLWLNHDFGNVHSVQKVIDGFAALPRSRLPNVAGAIDCTHFKLSSPNGGARRADYRDREKRFSLVMQAVVDASSKFLHITNGIPGSVHDSRVLSMSSLMAAVTQNIAPVLTAPMLELAEGVNIRPYILGDAGYPLLGWLMTPYPGTRTAMGPVHWRYNYLQSSARMVVECAFGLLKKRFRLLDGATQVRDVARTTDMITAGCILHNICVDHRDRAVTEEDLNLEEDVDLAYPNSHAENAAAGEAARDALAHHLFNR